MLRMSALLLSLWSLNSFAQEVTKECFLIQGMHCSSCKEKIEKRLLSEKGVISASVNLRHERGEVTYLKSEKGIDFLLAVKEAGYEGQKTSCLN